MKLKLDENIDVRLTSLFTEPGDDVDTVRNEELTGQSDEIIFEASVRSGRTLLTLDLDFASPLRFPPAKSAGVVVLRPGRTTLTLIKAALIRALPELRSASLTGRLLIVEPDRIRVYDPSDQPETL